MSVSVITNQNKVNQNQEVLGSSNKYIQSIIEFKNILMELTKFRITFFVTVTTTVGFLLSSGKFNLDLLIVSLGVLVLASGASSLNEYQERNSDAKMERTKLRPIPAGRISGNNALLVSITLIFLGSAILFVNGVTVLLLGIFTLIWYNGVYTNLKTKTAYAILPGSLVGALPPVIGWAAAGGNIFDSEILALAGFLFIWQIPHFWLLLLMYDKQYKDAGYPTLSNVLSNAQIVKITFAWIIILVLSSALLIFVDLSSGIISNLILAVLGISVLYATIKIIKDQEREVYRKNFHFINLYVLCILFLITIENLV